MQRLADQIQREVAGLIRSELKDPRLGMVTISAVKVSKDMGYAESVCHGFRQRIGCSITRLVLLC
jgi:ribosome-binding factor A